MDWLIILAGELGEVMEVCQSSPHVSQGLGEGLQPYLVSGAVALGNDAIATNHAVII